MPDYGQNCRKWLIFYAHFFAAPDFLIKSNGFWTKFGHLLTKVEILLFTQNKNLIQFSGMKNKSLRSFYFVANSGGVGLASLHS